MEEHQIVLAIAGIAAGAMLCQWLAWRVKLPAILFLLLTGIVAGPVTGLLDPQAVFGDLLFPMVSLSVAIILFEGSLTLRFDEFKEIGTVVQRLVTVGALVTGIVIAVTAHYFLNFTWEIALLFGTLTLVTGPTVIMPMLRVVRPKAAVANILRWEGIVIDPIGALLAVVVYEYILASSQGNGLSQSLLIFGAVIVGGTAFGAFCGWLLGIILRRHWLPEYLHNLAALSTVLVAFIVSNLVIHESGLLTVTVMGMWLANMRGVDVRHILHFKESLSVLLISVLFIMLAARLDLQQLTALGPGALILLLVVQFIARPLSIAVSTYGSNLNWRERALLSWIAPRGIVAAAVSAIFALRLQEQGYAGAGLLVPMTFLVIIGTVVLQSATSRPLAHLLKVAEPTPSGYLFIGANSVARGIAKALQSMGYRVLLTDSSWENIRASRMAGLTTYFGNPMSQHADENMDLVGIGRLIALSPIAEINVLSTMRFRHDFGPENTFSVMTGQETRRSEKHRASDEHRGRIFGDAEMTFPKMASRLSHGAEFKTTTLTENFGWQEYLDKHGSKATVLFARDTKGWLHVLHEGHMLQPSAGWTLLSLLDNDSEAKVAKAKEAKEAKEAKAAIKEAKEEAKADNESNKSEVVASSNIPSA
ncbi:NhaP-type Na+/H+ or K+/H+ antiporter [Atopomonas hussainii]|uniref:NhaP-type Na+/H+ or K+/H+ antiporter n=1 Tax=Atopomonas hussainii TaxID=1429083 RepID=A0A1H7J1M6_9GAMM|nr:sodium:proton antiporter [Atopomonas hussainii]SEK66985.1 NhaP-type Na+/H+ or K+/H+ antiporter [Atopomonas hussainii]